jgi:hypothetical protein
MCENRYVRNHICTVLLYRKDGREQGRGMERTRDYVVTGKQIYREKRREFQKREVEKT